MQKKFSLHIIHRCSQLLNTQRQLETQLRLIVERQEQTEEKEKAERKEMPSQDADEMSKQQLLGRMRSNRAAVIKLEKACREGNPVHQVYEMEKAYWADTTEELVAEVVQGAAMQSGSSAEALIRLPSFVPQLVPPTSAPLLLCLQLSHQSQTLLLLGLCHLTSSPSTVKPPPRAGAGAEPETKEVGSEETGVQRLLAQLAIVTHCGDEWIALCTDSLSRASLRGASFAVPLALVRCMNGLLGRRRSVSSSQARAALTSAVKDMEPRLLAAAERLSALHGLSDDERAAVVGLRAAADRARLLDTPFYQPVSVEEKRIVFDAMVSEVGGGAGGFGGHWFTCANGHVYTIGECGGAMEEAKCMECGERVGGSQHRLVAGGRAAAFLSEVRAPTDAIVDGWQVL